MSTDQERWRAFADQAGVVYTEHAETWAERWRYANGERFPFGPPVGTPVINVDVEVGAGPKNTGYSSFVASLAFTADGNLIEFGVWE